MSLCTFEGLLHNLGYQPPVHVSRCQWTPVDVRDITSGVHFSISKSLRPCNQWYRPKSVWLLACMSVL